MIQRKQSLWLLVAALLNAGVFFFDLYHTHNLVNGVDTIGAPLRIGDHYPSLLLALVMTALPLVTIFMYKKRKQQLAMSFVSVLAIIAFISMTLTRVGSITPPPASGSYWVGAVLPVMATLFLFIAMLGIRKDDKLVKSMDRLR